MELGIVIIYDVCYTLFQVITTRSYDERLDTITAVRDAGISVCSGGILGLGETDEDRVGLIWEVSKSVLRVTSIMMKALMQSQYA